MTASAHQGSSRITLFGIALIWMVAQISVAVAHDSWINRGGYKNPAGEWYCVSPSRQYTEEVGTMRID
jgi:hypothetical protein